MVTRKIRCHGSRSHHRPFTLSQAGLWQWCLRVYERNPQEAVKATGRCAWAPWLGQQGRCDATRNRELGSFSVMNGEW